MRCAPKLIPLMSLITRNLPEAAALLDEPVAVGEAVIESQGKRLLAMGCQAVCLIKGGHGEGAESIDYLVSPQRHHCACRTAHLHAKHPRHRLLAVLGRRGGGLRKARIWKLRLRHAKAWISTAIAAADRFSVGHGHGPIHHFHGFY